MLSRTSEYALRALIHLARHREDWPISGKDIAREADVPPKYLSAVLSALVHAGVLESTRGKSGGFRMARTPRQTRLIQVLSPFEPFERRRCPFGNIICSDEEPCQAHAEWKKVAAAEQRFMERTSVHDVAFEQRPRPKRRTQRVTKRARR